jgi:hemerythrin
MEEITWTDKLSVGIAGIDEQHKRLIGMINRLIRDPGATTRSESISDLLSDMTAYALEHFATEEELMRRCGYPHMDEHIAAHDAFRESAAQFCIATMHGVEAVPENMLRYLSGWLMHHILEDDMAYRPFLVERGVQ